MILHLMRPDGAFVAGDTRTGVTSYAYPTSPHAREARHRPAIVAARMVAEEMDRSRIPEANGQRDQAIRRDTRLMAELQSKGSRALSAVPPSPRSFHT